MTESVDYLDISDLIWKGNVKEIIEYLETHLNEGYVEIYWDTYDASIYLSKYTGRNTGAST